MNAESCCLLTADYEQYLQSKVLVFNTTVRNTVMRNDKSFASFAVRLSSHCVRWTFTFSLKFMKNGVSNSMQIIIAPKLMPNKGIKMCDPKDILWCFVH
jgi:hypothetical protein